MTSCDTKKKKKPQKNPYNIQQERKRNELTHSMVNLVYTAHKWQYLRLRGEWSDINQQTVKCEHFTRVLNCVSVLEPVRNWLSPLEAAWETLPGKDSIRAVMQILLWAFKGNRSQSRRCVCVCVYRSADCCFFSSLSSSLYCAFIHGDVIFVSSSLSGGNSVLRNIHRASCSAYIDKRWNNSINIQLLCHSQGPGSSVTRTVSETESTSGALSVKVMVFLWFNQERITRFI